MQTGAVILGAGFARRFGADKRLAPLWGKTVAECTLEKYLAVFESVRLVTRADDALLHDRVAHMNVEVVTTQEAHLGMGHSLAAGFASLPWQWAFVALLDMPFVQLETLTKLHNHAKTEPVKHILRPVFQDAQGDHYGHPVGWHQQYFAELCCCQGDQGARQILKQNPTDTQPIVVVDPGILQDIDIPADLDPRPAPVR